MDGQQQASVAVSQNGVAGATQLIQIAAAAPKLYPRVFNQDGSVNSADNPASSGSIVILFATGQGVTRPPSITGRATVEPYPQPVVSVRVSVAGKDAEILFAGLAPGTVGVLQVNVRLPAAIDEKTAGVLLTVGAATSQNGVQVSVR
jgi:uncharacterized protein (TIGR03437 family)